MRIPKDSRKLVQDLRRDGWKVNVAGSGHRKLVSPAGDIRALDPDPPNPDLADRLRAALVELRAVPFDRPRCAPTTVGPPRICDDRLDCDHPAGYVTTDVDAGGDYNICACCLDEDLQDECP